MLSVQNTRPHFLYLTNSVKIYHSIADMKKRLASLHQQSAHPDLELKDQFNEILSILGITWLVDPRELEVLCVSLYSNVDTIVTDDNDAFLHGARNVIRYLFDSKKPARLYSSNDMPRSATN